MNPNRTNNKLWFWTYQGEFASHLKGGGVHHKKWPIQALTEAKSCVWGTQPPLAAGSDQVQWFRIRFRISLIHIPASPSHKTVGGNGGGRTGAGRGRHKKQTNKKQQKLSLRKKRKVLNPFKCMLPRNPLLAILCYPFHHACLTVFGKKWHWGSVIV